MMIAKNIHLYNTWPFSKLPHPSVCLGPCYAVLSKCQGRQSTSHNSLDGQQEMTSLSKVITESDEAAGRDKAREGEELWG